MICLGFNASSIKTRKGHTKKTTSELLCWRRLLSIFNRNCCCCCRSEIFKLTENKMKPPKNADA